MIETGLASGISKWKLLSIFNVSESAEPPQSTVPGLHAQKSHLPPSPEHTHSAPVPCPHFRVLLIFIRRVGSTRGQALCCWRCGEFRGAQRCSGKSSDLRTGSELLSTFSPPHYLGDLDGPLPSPTLLFLTCAMGIKTLLHRFAVNIQMR